MQVITPAEVKIRKQEIKEKILSGEVFIHPTDTIYGLGCNALSSKAINKIREVKKRPSTPFSVIAPSVEWIKENCVITKEGEKWLKELPGPLTLILKTKNSPVASEVNPNVESLGVRIPNHWISKFVEWLGVPIITTSVNVIDEPFMTKIEDLDLDMNVNIKRKLGFALYEGEKTGRPSKIIHLEKDEVKVRER